ncbi:MAG: tetratricopeptide repeat protein [Bryobacteraceae bacterium]
MKRCFVTLFLLAAVALAQPKKEDPVGLVLLPGGGKLLRAGAELPLSAKSGDILFAGDAVRTEGAAATLLYCPSKLSLSLGPQGDLLLDAKQFKVRAGKLTDQKPVASCFLPQLVRVATASQQHYGVTMTRALKGAETLNLEPLTPEIQAELAPIEKALAADPKDQGALVAQAAIFEKHNLTARALEAYKKIASEFQDTVWAKGKIFELEESLANKAAETAVAATAGGKTFALLVGVSKYQKLPQDQWLQFAHADATIFEKHVRSPRGGGVPDENVVLLTDEKATISAVRNAFQTFLKGRATKQDTVMILLAGHGTVEIPGSRQAFILTYDSDPQDLTNTALPMADVQALVEEELANVGRVALFADVCRAGTIGSIKSTTVNSSVERLGDAEGELLGLLASRPKELSHEGPQWGGGHGVFSYFLIKALNGDGDKDKDGIVNVNEVIDYVRDKVQEATADKQHPREFGTYSNSVALSDVKKPGIEVARFPVLVDTANGEPLLFAAQAPAPLSTEASRAIDRFSRALDANRILPDQQDSAFAVLPALRAALTPEQYLTQENRLRIALENQGQQVLLRYLTGDQVPQTRQDFASGAKFTKAAATLTPESMLLDARESFFQGRTLLFDKKYTEAADLLERAVRADPNGAYSYNALGIAHLEQANYSQAVAAFRDAVRRAPHWAYPLHNLALSYAELGDYNASIRSYQQAMRLTPQYFYLPYNLGLVYQRLNRRKDAERSYLKAVSLAPESAEPYNALGSLKASQSKFAEAERYYRTALEKNPDLLAARQNLALLLSERPDRASEAVDLWRANLQRQSGYLPSRLGLAETLGRRGDTAGAIAEYREVLKLRPEYTAARLAVAELLEKSGDADGALAELVTARNAEADNPAILERIGDLEKARGRMAEAATAYEQALENADRETTKRIRKKMKTR